MLSSPRLDSSEGLPEIDPDVDIPEVAEFESDEEISDPPLPAQWTGSKYDLIKVKVWLRDHYYVLSRFLMSRMLTLIRISPDESSRISLELKKHLVDNKMLSISQIGLEKELFAIMNKHGFGEEYNRIFIRLQSLYQLRVPVLILIAGTGCIGKSFLATQLAELLNQPNVVQTDLIFDILQSNKELNLSPVPLAYRSFATRDELIAEYQREAHLVRRAVNTDIEKCLNDGKAVIVEGLHVDPSLYVDLIYKYRADGSDKRRVVILPWVLTMKQKAHRLFVENWLSCSVSDQKLAAQLSEDPMVHTNSIIENFQTIASYLSDFVPPFEQVVVNAQSLPDTLDALHNKYLDAVDHTVSGPSIEQL